MLGTTWRTTHLTILRISNHQTSSDCSSTVDVGSVKLSSDSFCANRVFKMNTEFCCHLCCNSSMNLLDMVFLNVRRSLSLSFGFRPLFLLDDIFPWFVYVVITLETAALDTPNKVAILLQMHQLNAQKKSNLFQNMKSLPFCCTFIRTITNRNL